MLVPAHGDVVRGKEACRAQLEAHFLPEGFRSGSREAPMALLWSERGEAQARASLRQALTGLRKDLGEDAAALIVTNDAVALDPDKVALEDAESGGELLAKLGEDFRGNVIRAGAFQQQTELDTGTHEQGHYQAEKDG